MVAPAVVEAECDIPWHKREQWPAEVLGAAQLLRDRFVSPARVDEGYLHTGVQTLDDQTRAAFTTFAPYAYDSTFWGPTGQLATVNDEGTSFVVALKSDEADTLSRALGSTRVVTLAEWRQRHPSGLKRLLRRLMWRG